MTNFVRFGSTQFSLFRTIFGLYLTIHLYQLWDYSKEVFSNEGMIPNSENIPTYGLIPNILFYFDSPNWIKFFLATWIFTSILITCGIYRRISSLWTFYGWFCLFHRNFFISNPGMAYIGWLLLMMTIIPTGEKKCFWKKSNFSPSNKVWEMESIIYYGAWAIMAISYSVSGIHKLSAPSWVDGTALHHVLTGPLARNTWYVKMAQYLPDMFFTINTWISLFAEISFGFLGIFWRTRKMYWIFFMIFHIGILATISFADLTLGVMMIHLFTFDHSWFSYTQKLFDHLDGYLPPKTQYFKIDSETDETKDSPRIAKIKEFAPWIIQALTMIGVMIGFATYIRYHNISMSSVWETVNRMTDITFSVSSVFLFVILILGCLMLGERIYPDQNLKQVNGWWKWAIGVNIVQLIVSLTATVTWEKMLQETSYFTNATGFHLRDYVSPFIGGVISYVSAMWIFYWWHLFRHYIYFLWIATHQFHHSATRIEAITSFYKHPLEMMLDSQILSLYAFGVLGISVESHTWLSCLCALGEYFYHVNLRTPRWIGYIFQRPESHRWHHKLNSRISCPNYSDLPIWDWLGGTFYNPDRMDKPTGFNKLNDEKRWEMLAFQDVLKNYKPTAKKIWRGIIIYFLIFWGLANSVGFFVHSEKIKPVVNLSVASPLPLVFTSYNGVETFATRFEMSALLENKTWYNQTLTSDVNAQLKGPYNRRNVYGALLSYGPYFTNQDLIHLRDNILKYGVCQSSLGQELGINQPIIKLQIVVSLLTKNESRKETLAVVCKNNSVLDM